MCVPQTAQITPDRFDFVWRPKPKQVTRYRVTMHVELPGTKMSLTAELVQSIGERDPKGSFPVTTATKNIRVVTDSDSETLPDEPPNIERYDGRGRRLATSDPDEPPDWFSNNLGHCTDFVPPPGAVKVGQKWSTPVPAGGGLLAGRLDYRLIDVGMRGKRSLLHVRFTYGETAARMPVHADGYFYIDAQDYSVVESEAIVHNVRISPDLPQSPECDVRMVRIEGAPPKARKSDKAPRSGGRARNSGHGGQNIYSN